MARREDTAFSLAEPRQAVEVAASGQLRQLPDRLCGAADDDGPPRRSDCADLAAAHLLSGDALRSDQRRATALLGHGLEPGRSHRRGLAARRFYGGATT